LLECSFGLLTRAIPSGLNNLRGEQLTEGTVEN
jgi:hypothetical protein